MKNKDDAGFNQDTCQNIAQIACGGDFQELCDHLSTSSSTLGKELTGGSWTVFFPTDQAFRDIEDNVIEKFDDDKVNQLLLFHVIENQELTFDDLTCTEKVLMYNGKHSRTKCEYNLLESARPRTPIKHQNGSGNNKMGNKPVIIRSNVPACNGIIHIVDSLLLPFTPKLIGDDDMGGDPGFGLDPTCDPSPDCEPRYGNGQQLTFCCITDDQWEPGLIGNDDLGGDPGFGIDPNQCDGIYTVLQYLKCIVECSNECVPRYNNDVQLVFCCLTDGQWIGNDDMGGDPGFGSLRRVSDLPSCTDVDPVISADVTSAVIPLELLRQYIGTSPTTPPYVVSFEDKDQGGMVDVVTDPPTPCEDSTILSNSALWCNTKGQQIIRAQTHGMCLQDSDPEYYYIKFVSTNYFATTGVCTLLRVSRNAPGTWTEYQTESMPTTGGAIEWVYNDEDVGKRFKYSLCPDTVDDKNIVKVVVTTFE